MNHWITSSYGLDCIPPPLAIRPELKQEDVDWLNDQMAITGKPPVKYSRRLPRPPAHVQYNA